MSLRIGNPLPVVFADMRRHPMAVAAVVLLIALSVGLGVAVSVNERALREGSTRAAAPFDLVVGAPGSETQLVLATVYLQAASMNLVDGAVLKALDTDDGVRYAAPVAFGDAWHGYPVVGTSVDLLTRGGTVAPAEGRVFATLFEAVIGARTPLEVGDEFTPVHGRLDFSRRGHDSNDSNGDDLDDGAHGMFRYHVVGRMPPTGGPWDEAIVVPVESIWRIHALPTGHESLDPARIGPPWDGTHVPGVPAIVVKPETVRDAYVLRSRHRNTETMALFPAEVLVRLYRVLGDARTVLAAVAAGTQVLVVGAILLAVVSALAQRRRQFAVLRALGASRGYVFAVIWLHVTLMIIVGGVVGVLIGWLSGALLAGLFESETGVALLVRPGARELAMVVVLVALGTMLAVIPGLWTYRQPVSSGLKS